eukprot:3812657-Amphidinium_carterae.2
MSFYAHTHTPGDKISAILVKRLRIPQSAIDDVPGSHKAKPFHSLTIWTQLFGKGDFHGDDFKHSGPSCRGPWVSKSERWPMDKDIVELPILHPKVIATTEAVHL